MDEQVRTAARRMNPYGLDVLTGADGRGKLVAPTLDRVAEVSCKPLTTIGVQRDAGAHALRKDTLHVVPGMEQQGCFQPGEPDDRPGGSTPSWQNPGDKVCHGG